MRKLYRSRYNKKIAGICGGLGNYFTIDPVFIRLIFVFLIIPTALLMPFIYLISSLIIPLEPLNAPAIEVKRLYRIPHKRVIAGVCGGLARHFKIDPTVLRLIIVLLTLITGFFPMAIAYLIGWITIPEQKI